MENLIVQDLKPIRSPAQNLGWGESCAGAEMTAMILSHHQPMLAIYGVWTQLLAMT